MSTKRLWAIAGTAVAVFAIVILVLSLVIPHSTEAEPTPTATSPAKATPTPTPTASATPAPTFTPPPTVQATCENTSTAQFRAMMASNGWISWETLDQPIGARPFDTFPNGTPDGAIVCRWGADPNLATDNVIDLAWSLIDPESAVAAMTKLEEEGFVRIEAPEGVYLTVQAEPGSGDEAGWGTTYLFGFDDVRWAVTKADVANYVKAPTEPD